MSRKEFSVWARKVIKDLHYDVPKSKYSTFDGLMEQWDKAPTQKKQRQQYERGIRHIFYAVSSPRKYWWTKSKKFKVR